MDRPDRLRELLDLQERAAGLARQVGAQLRAGTQPGQLVPLLREQAEIVVRIQARLGEFSAGQPAAHREEIEHLRAAFEPLVEAVEENHRLAACKGVRLTGIGGKPHRPRKKETGNRSTDTR